VGDREAFKWNKIKTCDILGNCTPGSVNVSPGPTFRPIVTRPVVPGPVVTFPTTTVWPPKKKVDPASERIRKCITDMMKNANKVTSNIDS